MASGKVLCSTWGSAWCLWTREEIQVYTQLIHFGVPQKLTQLCKTTMPQLKTQHPALGLTNVLLCINKACRFESLSQQFLNLFPSEDKAAHLNFSPTETAHPQHRSAHG